VQRGGYTVPLMEPHTMAVEEEAAGDRGRVRQSAHVGSTRVALSAVPGTGSPRSLRNAMFVRMIGVADGRSI
jgi:hypothetical protein